MGDRGRSLVSHELAERYMVQGLVRHLTLPLTLEANVTHCSQASMDEINFVLAPEDLSRERGFASSLPNELSEIRESKNFGSKESLGRRILPLF